VQTDGSRRKAQPTAGCVFGTRRRGRLSMRCWDTREPSPAWLSRLTTPGFVQAARIERCGYGDRTTVRWRLSIQTLIAGTGWERWPLEGAKVGWRRPQVRGEALSLTVASSSG